MNQNIEIKARVENLSSLEEILTSAEVKGPEVLHQEDTFFAVEKGRLKMRRFSAQKGELISYFRPDKAGPKTSQYSIYPTSQPDKLLQVLSHSHSLLGKVIKKRTLYLDGATRIHLDEVEGLGSFVELEVVLTPPMSKEEGEMKAREWMERLGIETSHLLEGAYIDFLSR